MEVHRLFLRLSVRESIHHVFNGHSTLGASAAHGARRRASARALAEYVEVTRRVHRGTCNGVCLWICFHTSLMAPYRTETIRLITCMRGGILCTKPLPRGQPATEDRLPKPSEWDSRVGDRTPTHCTGDRCKLSSSCGEDWRSSAW
jgi:hypothetical protein